jgi:hypothetical protein
MPTPPIREEHALQGEGKPRGEGGLQGEGKP